LTSSWRCWSESARRVLDYSSAATFDPNFFSHVHGRNLRRVMRDLARMVRNDLKRARWLLRLQTAEDRWRWFRVKALNRLSDDETIRLQLFPIGGL
jgi:hypothetical protein